MDNRTSLETELKNIDSGKSTIVTVFRTVCYIMSMWIIIVHGMFLVCFYRNRTAIWIRKAVGIITLTLTDFLSGVNLLVFLVVQSRKNVECYVCLIMSGSYLSVNFMTSLQILSLCAKRLLAISSKSRRSIESQQKNVIQYVVMYLITSGLTSLPLIWVQWRPSYAPCSLSSMFGDRTNKVCLFMLIIIATPNIMTSLIYICVLIKLKARSRNIQPTVSMLSTITTRTAAQMGAPGTNPNENQPASSTYTMQKYFRKAMATIGVILLLNIVAITPYSILLSLQSQVINAEEYPSYVWIGSAIFLQINNVFSPFVYGLRIPAIRIAFKKMLNGIFCHCERFIGRGTIN